MTFKSWGQWGRERQQRSLLREHENYKLEALEDREVSKSPGHDDDDLIYIMEKVDRDYEQQPQPQPQKEDDE